MKYQIDIEGLPEGWEPVAVRLPTPEDSVLKSHGRVNHWAQLSDAERITPQIILVQLPKTKPRRIVLEETGEDNVSDGKYYKDQGFMVGKVLVVSQPKIWRVVEES